MNKSLTPANRVAIEREMNRPHIEDFIANLFSDFFEQKGDHLYDEDRSIYGGIARFHGIPVTVLGHHKGHSIAQNLEDNFGMPCPEGYRKALRIMEQADKFHRPIITFVDTPGAYPGQEAEEHGQGEAIARNLAAMSHFSVPIITIVTGEGNSGGALAISVANRIIMLENAVYSVLSPEGFASILWKDSSRADEACDVMKMTAMDLKEAGVCDVIIDEPEGGMQKNPQEVYNLLDAEIERLLKDYSSMSPSEIVEDRHNKFRNIGMVNEPKSIFFGKRKKA
ncbi:acetyl-CoA carboxylase carboxyltransferase subunit alpha [Butyrivibrio sp. NC3005]|uniref:acetyl-CoA carboxylase carboxyltransferase subunit alpha n=1 Tax=Butyrivibrio sp. NC3005 TaxID=1280685 RepID=UPI000424A98D|nr:acetyl-CoA carboxylase carboxyltransferase subunit alpha [Butyrivibrio sp. NC3005]